MTPARRVVSTLAVALLAACVSAQTAQSPQTQQTLQTPQAPQAPQSPPQQPLETADQFQGPEAERFLARARVRAIRDLGTGVTRPQRATLELDGVERFGVFKTIDEKKAGISQFKGGSEMNFQDSWKCEIPAYTIDLMIGLRLVPATVERSINGQIGSLQWWIQSVMSEAERRDKAVLPPDPEEFERRRLKMHLFDELIANVDRHLNNIRITSDFELRLIDHSRSFRATRELKDPARLTKFSRALLDGIKKLEYNALRTRTVRYLDDAQIRAVLARRDAIVALADKLIKDKGEAAVIYP